MPSATIEAALKMHSTLGIGRGLIVQSTAYGTDHAVLLNALAAAGPNYRGCAIINDTVSDQELEALRKAGVVGARFNFLKSLNMLPSRESFRRTIARAAELGWVVKMQPSSEGVAEYSPWFDDIGIPVIVDHLGRVEFDRVNHGPNMKTLLNLLERGNFWVMLSNGHKWSKQCSPWDDVVPVVRTIAEKAPDRMIWATDWPHPVSTSPVPNDADVLELFYRCFPEPELRRKILVDNPTKLFGFNTGVDSRKD
jgi:predicted TIM-barrel fold metal-dependent hydrolase